MGILKLVLTPLFSSSTDWHPAAAASKSDCQSHFQIRAVQSLDLSALAEILAHGFHSQNGIFGWAYPLLRLGIYEDLRNRLRSASSHQICLVAVDPAATCSIAGDDLAGTVEMALRSTDLWQCDGNAVVKSVPSRYPYLSNLAVCPTYRRRGVAQQLLLKCERVALSWGFQDLYLHVLENNYQARQLYFKLGYRLHQVDSSWSAWLLGRPRQLFLHKHLSGADSPGS